MNKLKMDSRKLRLKLMLCVLIGALILVYTQVTNFKTESYNYEAMDSDSLIINVIKGIWESFKKLFSKNDTFEGKIYGDNDEKVCFHCIF